MVSYMPKHEVFGLSELLGGVFSSCSPKVSFGESGGNFYVSGIKLDYINRLGYDNDRFDSKLFNERYSALSDLLSCFTRLESLTISDGPPSLDIVSGLYNLKSLKVNNLESGDLSPLSSLGSLESLEVHLSSLVGKPLRKLCVGGKVLDVSPLSGMSSLEYLRLNINESVDCSVIGVLPNLEYFYLPKLADNSFVNNFVNLRELECYSSSSLDSVSLPNLEKLNLSYCKDVKNFGFLFNCPRLTKLFLSNCGAVDLSKFGYSPSLKEIVFSDTGFDSFSGFFNLPSVERFILSNHQSSTNFPFLVEHRDGYGWGYSLNYSSFPELRAFRLSGSGNSVLEYIGHDSLVNLLKEDILSGRLNDLSPLIMLDSNLVRFVINDDLVQFSGMIGVDKSVLSDYYWNKIKQPIIDRAVVWNDSSLKIRL